MTRRRVAAALALVAAIVLAALGVWQVERRAWKLDLIARTQARLAAAPTDVPMPSQWAAIGRDDAYRRLRATGRWSAAAPVFTQAVTDLGPGWWMLQPLVTPRGVVLVNRGFVPADARSRMAVATGTATITGLLRVTEPRGGFLRRNDPAEDRWYSRDVAAIARARGLHDVAPFFIDADAGHTRGASWPRGGMTVVSFPNNHLVYALTWFALAAMAAWFAWHVARERKAG